MIQNMCSYIPFYDFSVAEFQEYPKTAIVTTLFLTYVALCIYDTYSKGIKIRVGIGDRPSRVPAGHIGIVQKQPLQFHRRICDFL